MGDPGQSRLLLRLQTNILTLIPTPTPVAKKVMTPTPVPTLVIKKFFSSDSDSKLSKIGVDSRYDSDSGVGIAHLCT